MIARRGQNGNGEKSLQTLIPGFQHVFVCICRTAVSFHHIAALQNKGGIGFCCLFIGGGQQTWQPFLPHFGIPFPGFGNAFRVKFCIFGVVVGVTEENDAVGILCGTDRQREQNGKKKCRTEKVFHLFTPVYSG